MVVVGLYDQSRLLEGLVCSGVLNLVNEPGVEDSDSFRDVCCIDELEDTFLK
jgi:hypothetical protein